MNKKLRTNLALGVLAVSLGLMAGSAHAANPDTMTLSVTPIGLTYSVQITSVNGSGYQFQNVPVGGTTVSTMPIVVSNTGGGNTSEYFGLKVSNSSPDGWTPGAPGADTFRLIGMFATNQPATGITGFPTASAITTNFPPAAAALYGQSGKTNVGDTKNLWLQLEMPTAINAGSGGAQTIVLYIQGQTS